MSTLAKQLRIKPTRDSDPDATDVRLAQRGDLEAFERLYRRHVAKINGLATWMLGTGDTDDAIQDIFIRAWSKLDTFRGAAAFGTWLHKLAVNVLLRLRESLRVGQDRYVADDDAIAAAPARSDGFQLYAEIETAVGQLPQRMRDVFVLHDVEGYRHKEIAELLGVKAATSRWHLHAARAALREHFE